MIKNMDIKSLQQYIGKIILLGEWKLHKVVSIEQHSNRIRFTDSDKTAITIPENSDLKIIEVN